MSLYTEWRNLSDNHESSRSRSKVLGRIFKGRSINIQ